MTALSTVATGPRTIEGKAKASKNATKHGLLSREVLVAGDSRAEYNRLAESFYAELSPAGELERLLVERIVTSAWRLKRIVRVEAELFDRHRFAATYGHIDGEDQGLVTAWMRHDGDSKFQGLSRYEAALERSMYRALHELERAQAARDGQVVPVPAVLDVQVSRAGDDP